MPCRDMTGCAFDVAGLVIEEEIGLEFAQELALGKAPEEQRFVDRQVPFHERADGPLMRGGAACGDQGGADARGRTFQTLQAVQGLQQRLEGTIAQRIGRLGLFVGLKGLQAIAAEDLFGLIGEQHGIAVEGDPNLIRMGFGGVGRVGIDPSGRHAGAQCRAHIGLIG